MSHPVVLVPHDPAWKYAASDEASRIRGILGPHQIAIHHIGSTSIPGIKAKPVLDLLGVVSRIEVLDQNPRLLQRLGYDARGEIGIPGRRYFRRPPDGPATHHLHCFAQGDPNIDRHLLFRDYLLSHPETATAYERLKEALAARFPNGSPAYADTKTDFIRDIERTAAEWRK